MLLGGHSEIQESIDMCSKLFRVLIQEAVATVRVDNQMPVRYLLLEQKAVESWEHVIVLIHTPN
jgi:hypothetical protein